MVAGDLPIALAKWYEHTKWVLDRMDDFLIFGGSRTEVRERGRAAREYLQKLQLEVRPDKYRVLRS